jgi:hypothetical protein
MTKIHNFVQNFKSCVKKHLSIIISVAYVIGPSVNMLQNRETQHVNIVLQYVLIFWIAFKCFHILIWFFLPQPGFLNLFEFSVAKII